MGYLGSWKTDDLLSFYVNTHRFDTGVATDADAVPTYRVYEDETATPLLTGSMALIDSSNTAGFYSEQITLSAANGFEKGKCYSIYITATVNSVAATTSKVFQMEAEVDANTVSPTVSANMVQISGDTTAADTCESFFDGTGYAGTNNVIPTVSSVTAIATGGITAASIATDAIDADAIKADAITEIQSGLATSSDVSTVNTNVGTVITNLAVVDTNVDTLVTNLAIVDSNVDTLLTDLAVVDGNVDSILDDTGTTGVKVLGSQLFIKKNVAFSNFCFVMTSSTTHAPATGLTVSAQHSLDGGAFSAIAGAITEVSNGLYKVDLLQAETNAVTITLRFTATGADDRLISIVTQA